MTSTPYSTPGKGTGATGGMASQLDANDAAELQRLREENPRVKDEIRHLKGMFIVIDVSSCNTRVINNNTKGCVITGHNANSSCIGSSVGSADDSFIDSNDNSPISNTVGSSIFTADSGFSGSSHNSAIGSTDSCFIGRTDSNFIGSSFSPTSSSSFSPTSSSSFGQRNNRSSTGDQECADTNSYSSEYAVGSNNLNSSNSPSSINSSLNDNSTVSSNNPVCSGSENSSTNSSSSHDGRLASSRSYVRGSSSIENNKKLHTRSCYVYMMRRRGLRQGAEYGNQPVLSRWRWEEECPSKISDSSLIDSSGSSPCWQPRQQLCHQVGNNTDRHCASSNGSSCNSTDDNSNENDHCNSVSRITVLEIGEGRLGPGQVNMEDEEFFEATLMYCRLCQLEVRGKEYRNRLGSSIEALGGAVTCVSRVQNFLITSAIYTAHVQESLPLPIL
ncbi:protein rtoA-like [Haliotis asinina]|uniref:protein rtoA-like n=1 Tax=Haliotis asinina TaxID=109174 RepID=UPI00353222DF